VAEVVVPVAAIEEVIRPVANPAIAAALLVVAVVEAMEEEETSHHVVTDVIPASVAVVPTFVVEEVTSAVEEGVTVEGFAVVAEEVVVGKHATRLPKQLTLIKKQRRWRICRDLLQQP